MQGSFTSESLQVYTSLVADQHSSDFSETEAYDFTRCVRPNGTAYGTGGTCKKGTQQAKPEEPKTRKAPFTKDPERSARDKAVRDRDREQLGAIERHLSTGSKDEKAQKLKEEIARLNAISGRPSKKLLSRMGELNDRLVELTGKGTKTGIGEPNQKYPVDQKKGFKEAEKLLGEIPKLTRKIRSNQVKKKHPELVKELMNIMDQVKVLLSDESPVREKQQESYKVVWDTDYLP